MVVHVFAGDLEKGAHHISSSGCGEFMTDQAAYGCMQTWRVAVRMLVSRALHR